MANKDSGIRDEIAAWRKFLKGVLARADRPHRLDRDHTRGKYGVGYDPLPSGLCTKHRMLDKDGNYDYTVNDPFCPVCFPQAHRSARRG